MGGGRWAGGGELIKRERLEPPTPPHEKTVRRTSGFQRIRWVVARMAFFGGGCRGGRTHSQSMARFHSPDSLYSRVWSDNRFHVQQFSVSCVQSKHFVAFHDNNSTTPWIPQDTHYMAFRPNFGISIHPNLSPDFFIDFQESQCMVAPALWADLLPL